MRQGKLLDLIFAGQAIANIPFVDLCRALKKLGFLERINGSHHIFVRKGVIEILTFQSKGGRAKPYQIRQVREVLLKYGLIGKRR